MKLKLTKVLALLIAITITIFAGYFQVKAANNRPQFPQFEKLCEYRIEVSQSPENEREFTFMAPNEVITPARREVLSGGIVEFTSKALENSQKFEQSSEGMLGPFYWRPAIEGWGLTYEFEGVPKFVAIVVIFWDRKNQDYKTACGYWGPLELEPILEIYFPIISNESN